MNEQAIYEALLDIKQTVGEVHATTKAVAESLAKHVTDDAAVEERVRSLELGQAKQKGAIKVWGMVATGLSALVGFAIGWFK